MAGVARVAGVAGIAGVTASPRTCVARRAIAAPTLSFALSDACSDGISFAFAVSDACSLAGIGVCAANRAGTTSATAIPRTRFIMDYLQ